MRDEMIADLRSDIRAAVIPILEAVRAAGWDVGPIAWESKSARTVKFTAESPSGRMAFVVCGESALPDRLQALINEN